MQFFIFQVKALLGSKLSASKNKLFLRLPILLIPSYFAFLVPIRAISYGCQIAPWDSLNTKKMFPKDTNFWTL